MKIRVKVKPGAKIEKVEFLNQPELGLKMHQPEYDTYIVHVKALPIDGKANAAVIQALANHFNVALSLIRLDSGSKASIKLFTINI